MGRPTKVDYKAIEQEYVTTGLSYRELGRRHGINFSTLAARARAENWRDKRLAYEQTVSRKTYEKIADKVATEEAKIRDENILTLRLGIRKFAQDVAANKVSISASDATKMIETLARLVSEPDQVNPDDSITVVPVGRPDADLLRRIVEASRGRLDRPGLLEDPAGPGAEGTLIN